LHAGHLRAFSPRPTRYTLHRLSAVVRICSFTG
jgi:hypothetical protein